MASWKDEKWVILSVFDRITPRTRHYQSHGKMAKRTQGCMAGIAHDDVVENFDFEKLSGSNEVASDFDVRLGWSRIRA